MSSSTVTLQARLQGHEQVQIMQFNTYQNQVLLSISAATYIVM